MGWVATYGEYAKEFADWHSAAQNARQFIDAIAPPTRVTMLSLWDTLTRENEPLHVTDGVHVFSVKEINSVRTGGNDINKSFL